MTDQVTTISPVNGNIYVERPFADADQITRVLDKARRMQRIWQDESLDRRRETISRAVDLLLERTDMLAEEITWQMGRPLSQAGGEIRGFEERARYMLQVAPKALADIAVQDDGEFRKYIRKQPLGVIFVMAPWNYPYLTVANSLIPALLAGNAVLLKPSPQTPLVAERLVEIFREAGVPDGVFQYLHLADQDALSVIAKADLQGVVFTGSVANGRRVEQAAAGRFLPVGLELGGKDPAYVRADADLSGAVENLVDGAFYNSGQSCCAVERIYVHDSLYQDFIAAFAAQVRQYRLGNPCDENINLGPMVGALAAARVQGQIDAAIAAGAEGLIDPRLFPAAKPGTAYLAPQVLINVNHDMRVMTEESFGPVVGIMPVGGDEEAIRLMNDSPYGLTASIWSSDADAVTHIGERIETGTLFMNRCDYLDPGLAWTGVKESGRGCSLSELGFDYLTRPKSFHLRLK